MWVLLFYTSHIIPGDTASAGRGEHEVELLPFCSFIPGKMDGKWSSGVAPVLQQGWYVIVFLILGLERECGCRHLSTIVSFFPQHFHLPFSSLSQKMSDSGCAAVTLHQTKWAFLLVITLFYTLLLLVSLLLAFVFLISLMALFNTFLFQHRICIFIPLSLGETETNCLELYFQLVSKYNIQE